MLDDRSYMRQTPYPPRWSMTTILLAANVAVFLIQGVNGFQLPILKYFALSREGLSHGFLWQPVTFQFLHGDFLHLAFNMICLYFFGRFLEDRIGRMNFLNLYLISGVAGGLLQTMLGFVSMRHFGAPVVGASAGVYGLIAAFSLIEPNAIIRVWFILPIRALYFMYIAGGISFFYILAPSDGSNIAHAAHLGGLLGGIAFMRWDFIRATFFASGSSGPSRRQPRELLRVRKSRTSTWNRSPNGAPPDISPTEFISREVDPILDKILAHGFQSLTPEEKKTLEAARSKMRRR